MSVDVTASIFYKLGWQTALDKIGASLERPDDQTFQVHTETMTPATNGPDGPIAANALPTASNTDGIWNEHDKRVDRQVLPNIDTRTGL